MSKDEPEQVTKEHDRDELLPDAPEEQESTTATATHPKRKQSSQTILTQVTLRKPQWTYFHLSLHTSPPTSQPLDAPTARLHLTSALKQFLGLTGEAISIDFLKLEGQDLWIRVPREDGLAVTSALPGWVGGKDGLSVGWRIKGRDDWLPRLGAGDGRDLFGG